MTKLAKMLALLVAACAHQPYWFDPKIHLLGNTGIKGGFHAAIAPLVTKVIDVAAYEGLDMRSHIKAELQGTVLDLGCGVGLSTTSHGVDTSIQMVAMARLLHPDKTFEVGNAETYGEDSGYDFVTLFTFLHEVPMAGRHKILKNALRVASNAVIIADISPTYSPSETMLRGEPHLRDYLKYIHLDVCAVCPGAKVFEIVQDHLTVWVLPKA